MRGGPFGFSRLPLPVLERGDDAEGLGRLLNAGRYV